MSTCCLWRAALALPLLLLPLLLGGLAERSGLKAAAPASPVERRRLGPGWWTPAWWGRAVALREAHWRTAAAHCCWALGCTLRLWKSWTPAAAGGFGSQE